MTSKEEKAAYMKAWRQANKARLKAYNAAYKAEHREGIKVQKKGYDAGYNAAHSAKKIAYAKEYHAAHPEVVKKARAKHKCKIREATKDARAAAKVARHERALATRRRIKKAWKRRNPHAEATRRATKLQATPAWVDADERFLIEEAYALAILRAKMVGVKYHVDHIVPLRSKMVCGLHVPANLRVIPAAENISKGNRFWPDMP